ncbi:ABC transporter substrate-binding protein [Paracoccus luteus]|uniref:ABC transporter substrate-binding protein n=1 Tax=Paracoccus luteus TaxID=2508543 RepID=UPI0010706506|nr:ABC transporter substrate-binding protein [Paracoccus luteus]
MRLFNTTAMALALAIPAGAASAADVKIGMITTLSGPAGYLGADIRDGFELAMKDGTLGGIPVELEVQDDKLDPGQGRQIADRMLNDEEIKLLTGIVFSNVAGAVVPEITGSDAIYISANAGPSTLAGKGCSENYFVASWQNDTLHEMPGLLAQNQGYKTAFLAANNYQAGKDGLTGFKREFKGEILGEVYTPLGQTDFSAVIAQIRAANPEVVYQFHPGEAGIAFIKQYNQAGLTSIPMVLPEPASDAVILKALGDQAVGTKVALHWAENLDNPANKAMVAAWKEKYPERPLTSYAVQGYQTALIMAEGLKATGGDVSDIDALREGIRNARIESPSGNFAWGPNQHPVQDWYAAEVVKGADGVPVVAAGDKIAEARGDVHAAECSM